MLHIIYGKDPLARREAFAQLKASLDADGSLATNTTTLDARNTTPQEVIAACNTIPFLGDCRLVVVEGVLAQGGAKPRRGRAPASPKRSEAKTPDPAHPAGPPRREDAGSEADDRLEGEQSTDPTPWDLLAGYVPTMPPSTTLVLLDEEALATNALLKALGPLGKVDRCDPPGDKEVPAWVSSRAKKIGLKLDAPAAKLLAELIGPDALMLASELDKLLAYSAGDIVRVADVRELVSRAKEHKGWELSDAVVSGQGATAARILYELIEDGEPTPVLLSTIAGRYRRIAVCKDMLERGESGTAIANRCNVKIGFGLDKLIEQAERMSWPGIRECYARLIQAELDLKQGLMDERPALELAVQELAGRPIATRAGR